MSQSPPDRIWAFYAPEVAEDNPGCTIVAGERPMHGAAEYVRPTRAAPPVKPLEWEYHPAGTIAVGRAGGSYIIDTRGSRPRFLKWPHGFAPEIETVEEGKAAANADYTRRIHAALGLTEEGE